VFAVINTAAIPEHLRGYAGRFLQHLYVGKMSRRVADRLWDRLCETSGTGSLVMITSARNDAGFEVRLHQVAGTILVDMDGIVLPAEISTSEVPG
jgi:CRISPR-associated endoribonuclease Cas2 subtype I-E